MNYRFFIVGIVTFYLTGSTVFMNNVFAVRRNPERATQGTNPRLDDYVLQPPKHQAPPVEAKRAQHLPLGPINGAPKYSDKFKVAPDGKTYELHGTQHPVKEIPDLSK